MREALNGVGLVGRKGALSGEHQRAASPRSDNDRHLHPPLAGDCDGAEATARCGHRSTLAFCGSEVWLTTWKNRALRP